MKDMVSKYDTNYELIDSGMGRKFERIAGVMVERPSPQAIWKPLKESDWKQATSVCSRTKDGGGFWEHKKKLPEPLIFEQQILDKKLSFLLKFTSFGHCGLFFEQLPIWEQIAKNVTKQKELLKRPPKFLNLFGYTGAASLVAAAFGAEVVHVDSAKSVLEWGRKSQGLSKLDSAKVQWVHEDALKFMQFSAKKGKTFDGILLDPPSWGHGVKKEKWEFEKNLSDMMESVYQTLEKNNSFVIMTSHTHGVQAQALKNLFGKFSFSEEACGDLGVAHKNDSRILPAGMYYTGSKL
ncbi:MAG: class I SAM-dependent methyltransferase [Bacteriovoracaceae bacterium]|nr:class I SAM-dependent methyltransferase [Bacteriovoracaceae bacterium]